MALTNEELKNMIILQRQIVWQFDLDKFTDDTLKTIRNATNIAKRDILSYLGRVAPSPAEWTEDRLNTILAEVRALSLGVEGEITDGLTEGFITIGQEALFSQNNMLNFGGRIDRFNWATLSAGQLASAAQNTPIGGQLLNSWVKNTFDRNLLGTLREETLAALLKGEGYPVFVKRLEATFNKMARSELITLARSYIQAANVNAQVEVYRQNPEIVQHVEWSAAMEPGFYKTGRGTCLRCAGLDGQIFILGQNPPIPLHPRCRCILLPVTPSYRELGLDIDEVRESYRPFTIRNNKNVDVGGRRKILEVGFNKGNYKTWFEDRPNSFQLNVLGPSRKKLFDAGQVKFNQFVNNVTGNLYTLDELDIFIQDGFPS